MPNFKFVHKNKPPETVQIKEAMVEAGYSPLTAQNPSGVLNSKSFQDILAEKITTDEVLNVQKSNLHAKTMYTMRVDNQFTEDQARIAAEAIGGEYLSMSPPTRGGRTLYLVIPYYKIRDVSLDKLYKLAGVYASEKLEVSARPLQNLTDEQLAAQIAEAKKRFAKD